MTDKKWNLTKWNLKKYSKPNANLNIKTKYKWMVQIWERCKPLRLISPVNTDHAMFIWKSKPVSSFSRKLSRYQNSEILLSLNVIALSNSYMFIRSLQVWHGLESFFFLQHYFYTTLLLIMFIRMFDVQYWKNNNICNTWKIKKQKTKNLEVVYLLKRINGYF